MKKRIVILYSGGLDSFILRHYAKKTEPDAEVICVYYNHGQASNDKEMSVLPDFVEKLHIDWLTPGQELWSAKGRTDKNMIPGRNLVFAVASACKHLPNEVWLGGLHGENYSSATDKNEQFMRMTSDILSYVLSPFTEPVTVRAPFIELGLCKEGVIKWALGNGLTPDDLLATKSCYNGETDACGNCIQCFKRWAIFSQYGWSDNFHTPIWKSEVSLGIIEEILKTKLGIVNTFNDEFINANKSVIPFVVSHILDNESKYPQEIVNLAKKVNSYE